MRIEASINGEVICTAGLSGSGYLAANLIVAVGRPNPSNTLGVAGYETRASNSVHLSWPTTSVSEGDVVTLRLLSEAPLSEPSSRKLSSEAPSNLLSNTEDASHVLAACAAFSSALTGILSATNKEESPEEHAKFQRACGEVLANVGERLVSPIYRNHPSLVPMEWKGEPL